VSTIRRHEVSEQAVVEIGVAAELRARMLAGTGIADRRIEASGITTAVLEHGAGEDVVLLHGPGEFAIGWVETILGLAPTHHVVAPDLPGHGASAVGTESDVATMVEWLDALIAATCAGPPIIVGRVLGGALAARYCLGRLDGARRLVLVDTMGLSPFEPAPPFAEALHRFLATPSERSHAQLMEYCAYDFTAVRRRLGESWADISAYAVDRISDPARLQAIGALIAGFGVEIPKTDLAHIDVPTTLIWGRHDMATPLRVAETANRALGWPLIVIDEAADDPGFDQPEAFLDALETAFTTGGART
jgi:pimeloyl-ACP methyl ester carboxylesterase